MTRGWRASFGALGGPCHYGVVLLHSQILGPESPKGNGMGRPQDRTFCQGTAFLAIRACWEEGSSLASVQRPVGHRRAVVSHCLCLLGKEETALTTRTKGPQLWEASSLGSFGFS